MTVNKTSADYGVCPQQLLYTLGLPISAGEFLIMTNSLPTAIQCFSSRPAWTLAEIAWLIIDVAHAGRSFAHVGKCLGAITPGSICVVDGQLGRIIFEDGLRRVLAQRRSKKHLKQGHDLGCQTWGISVQSLEKIALSCGGEEASHMVAEITSTALKHVRDGSIAGLDAWEILTGEFSSTITPLPRKYWRNHPLPEYRTR